MKHSRVRSISVLAVVAAALGALFALSACSQLNINTNTHVSAEKTSSLAAGATITDGVLTVGVNASNTPYGGTNKNNETVGFDVDLAGALADELGLKLQIVDVNSNGKSMLGSGQIDLALGIMKSGSGSTITYTKPYINDGTSLFCKQENAEKAVKKFNRKKDKVLVQGNTPPAYEIQELLGVDAVTAYPTMKEAFQALEDGEGSYLAADAVVGYYFARGYSDIVRLNFMDSDSVTPMYGITLTEKAELTQGVKRALESLKDNGMLRVIVDKWLGSQGEEILPGQVDIAKITDLFAKEKKSEDGESSSDSTEADSTQSSSDSDNATSDGSGTQASDYSDGDDDGDNNTGEGLFDDTTDYSDNDE